MKKEALTLAVLLVIFVSLVAEVEFAKLVAANPYPYTNCDSSFVTVSIISPENKTYNTNSILLNITAGAFPGVWFVEYSLDGAEYIEIAPGHPLAHILTETVLVEQLPKGSHSIEVKASAMANDEDGLVIAYSKVYFSITKDLETTPSPSPTANSSPSPEPIAPISPTPFPTDYAGVGLSEAEIIIGLAIIVAIVIVCSGLLVYLIKRK